MLIEVCPLAGKFYKIETVFDCHSGIGIVHIAFTIRKAKKKKQNHNC